MFAGFDTIVIDLWSQMPRLVWCNVNDAYVVHFHRWCWTSRLSGLTVPFLFRYDRFDMSEQSFRTTVQVANSLGIPHNVSVQGRYRWTNIKAVVVDKGYSQLFELITTFIDEQVIDLMHTGDSLDAMNAELLSRIRNEYGAYMDWGSLTINPVLTLPIALNRED